MRENCAEGGERHFIYRWNGQQFVLDDIMEFTTEEWQPARMEVLSAACTI